MGSVRSKSGLGVGRRASSSMSAKESFTPYPGAMTGSKPIAATSSKLLAMRVRLLRLRDAAASAVEVSE